MRALLCPVCCGVGWLSAGFYSRAGDNPNWATANANLEECRSCKGKGYLLVPDDHYESETKTIISPIKEK